MRKSIGLALLPLLLSACIPMSLHPLIAKDEAVFDEALLGAWDGEDLGSYQVTRGADKDYRIMLREDGNEAIFQGRLGRVDGALFLQLVAEDFDSEVMPDLLLFHLAPAYTFYRIEEIGDELRLRSMDAKWLKDELEGKWFAPNYIEREDYPPLFTAKTSRLQRFVGNALDEDEAWTDVLTLKRTDEDAG